VPLAPRTGSLDTRRARSLGPRTRSKPASAGLSVILMLLYNIRITEKREPRGIVRT
jgi:hypothetical protein